MEYRALNAYEIILLAAIKNRSVRFNKRLLIHHNNRQIYVQVVSVRYIEGHVYHVFNAYNQTLDGQGGGGGNSDEHTLRVTGFLTHFVAHYRSGYGRLQ